MSSTDGALFRAGALKATNAIAYVRSLGFRPTKIVVFNVTNKTRVEWHAGMAEGVNIKTVAAGTVTVLASGGVEPVDADSSGNPGFKIPVLADVNDTIIESLTWEAFGGSPALNP